MLPVCPLFKIFPKKIALDNNGNDTVMYKEFEIDSTLPDRGGSTLIRVMGGVDIEIRDKTPSAESPPPRMGDDLVPSELKSFS